MMLSIHDCCASLHTHRLNQLCCMCTWIRMSEKRDLLISLVFSLSFATCTSSVSSLLFASIATRLLRILQWLSLIFYNERPGWWPMLWKPYPYACILIYTKTHSKAKQSFKISFWLIIPDRTGIIIITTWQEVYKRRTEGYI